ncbi:MAG: hypothetical protein QXS69_01350 [Candidatus Aenigmatarchaeota archaeon]
MVEVSLSIIIWTIIAIMGFLIFFYVIITLTKGGELRNFGVNICNVTIGWLSSSVCENLIKI